MARKKVQKSIADKEILTMEDAAEYLDVNRITMLELIREGKIPASKLRFRWRLKKSDIDYFVRHGKNPVTVEQEKEKEKEKAREASEKPEKKNPSPKKEVLDLEALERLKNSARPKRTLTTALLLKKAIALLSENPCYLVGPESETLLNTHIQDDGLGCDIIARGALSAVLFRAAELFSSEDLPPPSHRGHVLTLPAQLKSIEVVEEHLSRAIAEVGLIPFDSSLFMSCAGELVQNAVEAVGDGGKELRVIIEVGRDDLLLTVINPGCVQELPRRMPDPDSLRGRGIGMSKQYVDDFLFLSTNDQVIVTVRKAKGARREAPQSH